MTYRCCLCDAVDKIREGWIPDGGGVPLCAEHRAQTYWRSRQPPRPSAIMAPTVLERVLAHAMLVAANETA